MKKFIAIVILGFLFFNQAHTKSLSLESYLKPGLSKKEVKKRTQGFLGKIYKIDEFKKVSSQYSDYIGQIFFGGVYRKYYPEYKIEILSHYYKKGGNMNYWSASDPSTDPPKENYPYYVFENVTEPVSCSGTFKCSGLLGNGNLKAVVFSEKEAFDLVAPGFAEKIKKTKKPKTIAKKPEKKFNKDIPNLENSKWREDNTEYEFFSGGKCNYTINEFIKRKSDMCEWRQNNDKIYFETGGVYKVNATLNGNTFTGSWSNSMTNKSGNVFGEAMHITSWISKKTTIVKKPKTIDDGNIIKIGSGTGFVISKSGHVISNNHVVGVCKKVMTVVDGKEVFLDIIATDKVNDLGLIKGKVKTSTTLSIKSDGAELGEDIVAFGYPLTQQLSDSVKVTKGIVSALSGMDNNYSQIQIDAAIQPGNSGGPVLNMNGQVVGVASSGLSKLYMAKKAQYIPENVNFAVASPTLSNFLKANKINFSTGSSFRTLSTKDLAKIGRPATIQLFCMNTRSEYAKLKKAKTHSDMLLDLD